MNQGNGRVGMALPTQVKSDNILADGNDSGSLFDYFLNKDNDGLIEDISDNDSLLTEDLECPYISESETANDLEGKSSCAALIGSNELHLQCAMEKEKLDRLLEKDPGFSEFLECQKEDLEMFSGEEILSEREDATSNQDEAKIGDHSIMLEDDKAITSTTVDVWFWLVVQQPDGPALRSLLNGFHIACRYGISIDDVSYQRISDKEVFSKIVTFVLSEADGIFRGLLNIPISNTISKDAALKLRKTAKWIAIGPLIKFYLRSSLFLLNQVTDNQILVFTLSRLRASLMFFSFFPSMAARLLKTSIHFWVTGDQNLSQISFCILRDLAVCYDYEACLDNTYKAFIGCCKFVEPTNFEHINFMMNSVLDLYSLDVHKSREKVLIFLQHLSNVLKQALKARKKEDLEKISSWQYINCINLWVKFIRYNMKGHDLQSLLYLMIQLVQGTANLFPGQRYLPLRFKCIHMLNVLSVSSGIFIPVAYLLLDCLEHRGVNIADRTEKTDLDISSVLKVPKHMLKSPRFHDDCVLSAIELLAAHLAQWSYHISFPELATIPLAVLRRLHGKSTAEKHRRSIKCLIDQVELNSEFIQKKRDEVSFSPCNVTSVDTFLQLEKSRDTLPFTQYYNNVLLNSRFSPTTVEMPA